MAEREAKKQTNKNNELVQVGVLFFVLCFASPSVGQRLDAGKGCGHAFQQLGGCVSWVVGGGDGGVSGRGRGGEGGENSCSQPHPQTQPRLKTQKKHPPSLPSTHRQAAQGQDGAGRVPKTGGSVRVRRAGSVRQRAQRVSFRAALGDRVGWWGAPAAQVEGSRLDAADRRGGGGGVGVGRKGGAGQGRVFQGFLFFFFGGRVAGGGWWW
jgi:hypothetical protein